MKPIEAITQVCHHLSKEPQAVIQTLRENYPHGPRQTIKPAQDRASFSPVQAMRIFMRDGFVDRYFGERLVFPPVFRVITLAHPEHFPFHPRWKTNEIHPAYWDLYPEVDHGEALAAGGSNDDSNLFTTSASHNTEKLDRTLAQLGWKLHPRGDVKQWDGLVRWFMEYVEIHPHVLELDSVRLWHDASKKCLS